VAPCDPTTLPFAAAQAVVDAIWSDMGLRYPPAVAPLPRQATTTVARADRLSILLADRTPSWCVLHELAHAMTSHADGRSDGHGPLFMGVYLQLIVRYLRLDPPILIDSLRDAGMMRGSRSPATRVRCSSIPDSGGYVRRRASAAVSCTLTSRNERSSSSRLRASSPADCTWDRADPAVWRRLRPA
jgi:hypothetical protein